ncbi:hypothetical protein, partial [Lentilactobacillus kisonensis]
KTMGFLLAVLMWKSLPGAARFHNVAKPPLHQHITSKIKRQNKRSHDFSMAFLLSISGLITLGGLSLTYI